MTADRAPGDNLEVMRLLPRGSWFLLGVSVELSLAACGAPHGGPARASEMGGEGTGRERSAPEPEREAPAARPPAAGGAARGGEEEPAAELAAPTEGAVGEGAVGEGAAQSATEPLALVEATLDELGEALRSGRVTPPRLAERYLERIAAFDGAGPGLNAYLHVSDHVLGEADALGDRCRQADAGPLCGIPIAVKDNLDTADMPTTAGALALDGSQPSADSFVVRQLRAAGAVLLGKATLTELANFLTTGMPAGYSSLGGFGFNPYDPRPEPGGDGRPALSPGGSSSGSAIAVSANLAAAAVGTETAGSILSPASANGVVGIKPTVGLVSRAGIVPISADQDTAGPIARTVTDAAILLGVISGYDPDDAATAVCRQSDVCERDYRAALDPQALAGARFALPPVPSGRAAIMQAAVSALRAAGAQVQEVGALGARRGPCLSGTTNPSCSSVLLYGFKRDLDAYLAATAAATAAAPVGSLAELIAFNGATPEAVRYGQALALAAEALDTDPGSADTARYQADRERDVRESRGALDAVFDGPDADPGTADDFDAILFSGNSGAGVPAVAGYPSITVPGGFVEPSDTGAAAFPSGVTFSGRAFSEERLVALAFAFEQATGARRPPLSAPELADSAAE